MAKQFIITLDIGGHAEARCFDMVQDAVDHVADIAREVFTEHSNPEDFSITFNISDEGENS